MAARRDFEPWALSFELAGERGTARSLHSKPETPNPKLAS
jgi:hypothetical protein